MWIIVFITLVALIIGKFVYDIIRHTTEMKKAGGMAVKYAELVDGCLACSGARIIQETPTFISIGVNIPNIASLWIMPFGYIIHSIIN